MKNTQKQKNEQTQNKTQEGKRYLQNELMQYLIDHDAEHLNNIAYIIVKKTMFTYSQTSSQGQYLYTQARYKKTQNQDIQDLKSECIFSILEQLTDNEQDTSIIIKNAFRQVNNYLYSLRSIQISTRPFQYSIEELTENGIQLVNIHNGICALVKNDEYFDNVDTDTENEKRIQQQKQIKLILAHLTPIQKQVCKMLALGNSERQIADKMKRSKSTIHEHITSIRRIANKLIQNI